MLDKVRDYARKWQMLQKEDCVIAGVSGGADSVCLLFVLLELRKEIGFDLVVAHVNHGLRGEAANADEDYVKSLCETLGVPCECYFEDVELFAKNRKQSTEEAGREVRKAFFEELLLKYKGTKIALAHHQNDNAETLILNLTRGTGLKGLGGIAPMNGHVIRPLLCISREEVENYLNSKGISYCEDATNKEDDYTRNRVRNHVLSYLEQEVNGKAVEHMNETMEQLRQVQAYMEEQMRGCKSLCVKEMTGGEATECTSGFLVQAQTYQDIPEVIKPMLLKSVLVDVCGREKDLEAVHIKDLQELFEKQVGRKLDLPYQMEAKRVYEGIWIGEKRSETEIIEEEVWDLSEEKREISIAGYQIQCEQMEAAEMCAKECEKSHTKYFSCDIIKNSVMFRTRRSGDYITIHPDGRTQKLKTYFINEKIPQEERDSILLVADGSHVLWIVGHRVGCAYEVKENTKRVLKIHVNKGESYGRDN